VGQGGQVGNYLSEQKKTFMGLPFEKFVNSKLLLDVCRYTIILDGYFLDAPKLIGVGVLVFLFIGDFLPNFNP